MPPSKTSDKNLESESTLQAIILADSFNEQHLAVAGVQNNKRLYQ
ncbi:17531_t:CDS:2, partial [Cetraspora pellucida]